MTKTFFNHSKEIMSLNDQTKTIEAAAINGIKINEKTGLPEVDAELWAKSFEGAEVTREQYQASKRHVENFVAGMVSGTGKAMIGAYSANAELADLKVTIPMEGKDKLHIGSVRRQEFPIPGKPDEAPVVRYCAMTTKIETEASNKNAGSLGAVYKALREAAATALAS